MADAGSASTAKRSETTRTRLARPSGLSSTDSCRSRTLVGESMDGPDATMVSPWPCSRRCCSMTLTGMLLAQSVSPTRPVQRMEEDLRRLFPRRRKRGTAKVPSRLSRTAVATAFPASLTGSVPGNRRSRRTKSRVDHLLDATTRTQTAGAEETLFVTSSSTRPTREARLRREGEAKPSRSRSRRRARGCEDYSTGRDTRTRRSPSRRAGREPTGSTG